MNYIKILTQCLLLTFCCLPIFAQTSYKSIFGEEQTRWNCLANKEFGALTSRGCFKLISSNDTFINAILYKKININYFANLYNTEPEAFLIREVTLQGKIWYKELYENSCGHVDTNEQLIVDYNLQLGDTFKNLSGLLPSHLIGDTIAVVDSVYYDMLNRKHIRFTKMIFPPSIAPYTLLPYPVEFIEGIGPNISLVYRLNCSLFQRMVLVCDYKDGQQIFYDDRYPSCDPLRELSVRGVNAIDINIYPNPTTGSLTLNGLKGVNLLKIFSSSGKLVMEQQSTTSEVEIESNHLTSGIYILQVTNEEGQQQILKWMKQ